MEHILDVLDINFTKNEIAALKIHATQNIPLLLIVAIWQLSISKKRRRHYFKT